MTILRLGKGTDTVSQDLDLNTVENGSVIVAHLEYGKPLLAKIKDLDYKLVRFPFFCHTSNDCDRCPPLSHRQKWRHLEHSLSSKRTGYSKR